MNSTPEPKAQIIIDEADNGYVIIKTRGAKKVTKVAIDTANLFYQLACILDVDYIAEEITEEK